jgi:phenylacetate-CoA ligase
MAQGITISVRELNYYGFNHKKTRFAHIGNLSTNRIDLVMEEKLYGSLKRFYNFDHIMNIDVNQPIKTLMEKLNKFNPELLITYPAIHQHLAYLKKKGYGENFNPKLLFSAGAMLDEYTRSYVQDVLGCRLLNVYPSVEAGSNIAFECYEGHWHIHNDFFHLEAIDDNGEIVAPGERGHLVITKLYGRGTPIIRYSGMDDWVRITDYEKCSCGLTTPLIKNGVEGRARANIILPNGKIFPPGAFCFIEPILKKYNTYKVKQYQIIQKSIHEIEVLLVIDEDLRNVGTSLDVIKQSIKKLYQDKAGPDVKITITEVDEIKHPKDARKPPPIVVSNVTKNDGYKQLEK